MKTSQKHQNTFWKILDKKQFEKEILKKLKSENFQWLQKIRIWSEIENKRIKKTLNQE